MLSGSGTEASTPLLTTSAEASAKHVSLCFAQHQSLSIALREFSPSATAARPESGVHASAGTDGNRLPGEAAAALPASPIRIHQRVEGAAETLSHSEDRRTRRPNRRPAVSSPLSSTIRNCRKSVGLKMSVRWGSWHCGSIADYSPCRPSLRALASLKLFEITVISSRCSCFISYWLMQNSCQKIGCIFKSTESLQDHAVGSRM